VQVTVQRASASELQLDHVFIAPQPHDQLVMAADDEVRPPP